MKRLWKSALVLVGGVCLLFSEGLDLKAAVPDQQTREFRITYLGKSSSGGVKIQPQLGEVIRTKSNFYRTGTGPDSIYVFEREDFTKSGDKFLWRYELNSKYLGVNKISKKTISRSGVQVAENWINYRDIMYNYPENLYHVYILPYGFLTMKIEPGVTNDFYILTAEEAVPWHMFLKVVAEETLEVPAGKFECYKLSLEPDYKDIMGSWSWASPIISRFVPDYFFWVDKKTKNLIKFEGKFGPSSASPTQIHELVSMSTGKP